MAIYVWYDAENEVNPATSWTGLCPALNGAIVRPVNSCHYPRVIALNEFDRNDAIISIDSQPILTIEQTLMNPSGHNIPQRFSKLIKSAEFSVPSILYCTEYARRSNSDPNPRYLNVRVPLAQFRVQELFSQLCLTVIWPTSPTTLLASTRLQDHQNLADTVNEIVIAQINGQNLFTLPTVQHNLNEMDRVIQRYGKSRSYPPNASWRQLHVNGAPWTQRNAELPIDPPESCQLVNTRSYLEAVWNRFGKRIGVNRKTSFLLNRSYSLVFAATLNAQRSGPEHPYPGHLTMLDLLYARESGGMLVQDRDYNLICELPITLDVYKTQVINHTTGLYIMNETADIIILEDAVVAAGFLRKVSSGAVLVERS